MTGDGNTKLDGVAIGALAGIRQVRKGKQQELAVENAKYLILGKIETTDIVRDVLVTGRVAEPKVTISILQRQQMAQDMRPVTFCQHPYGHHQDFAKAWVLLDTLRRMQAIIELDARPTISQMYQLRIGH